MPIIHFTAPTINCVCHRIKSMFRVLGVYNFAGSSKRAPRILIFSIAMGAEYLFYMKSIETHARAFLPLNKSAIGSVC